MAKTTEAQRAAARAYYYAHREERLAYAKKQMEEHREEYNRRMNDYYHSKVKLTNAANKKEYDKFSKWLLVKNIDINTLTDEEIENYYEEYNK